ncbi:hypothetical protein HMPREF0043_00270 [Actinobaculum sp. oral taxon 183 str. F0552]|nr:hypothetical protein HMPREF0043_00270 [Actinobaculum sp. oral taxon 183 str. F0552]
MTVLSHELDFDTELYAIYSCIESRTGRRRGRPGLGGQRADEEGVYPRGRMREELGACDSQAFAKT